MKDGDDNADDVPNLQLAWEVLELSKKIYKAMLEKDQNESLKVDPNSLFDLKLDSLE